MKITQVAQEQNRRGVPVKGWPGVEAAITLYETGGSRAAEAQTADELSQSRGPLAAAFFVNAAAHFGSRSQLTGRLLANARARLVDEKAEKFSASFDYDALGTPFFKTTVDLEVIDRAEEIYIIGLYASYVGYEPEIKLATRLGVDRLLTSVAVEVETAPVDGRFEFDFDEIAARLHAAALSASNLPLSGNDMAHGMLAVRYGDSQIPYLLLRRDGLEAYIRPGQVGHRFEYDNGKSTDTFEVDGSILRGQLQRDYSSRDENVKAAPTFLITVQNAEKDGRDYPKPIWRPEAQLAAIELASKIAEAFQPVV